MQETGVFPSTFSSEHPHRQDEKNIVAMVECSLHQSTRRISSKLGVPHMSVWQALNFEGLYSYNIHHIQHLERQDYDIGLQFCRWINAHSVQCPLILFTDKTNLLVME
jgi:hypothetical protein